jgi:23S rRNA (cytosine1962-C5)-methyltransferase
VARRREGLSTGVRVLSDEVPDLVVVHGGPVCYEARLWTGQKTGGYLDQRENHLAAARYAKGRVLDVFSYVGGFSLHAGWRRSRPCM